MDHLYTPWRMTYLTEEKTAANVDCIFCAKAKYVDEATDQAEWIVARSKFVFVTLNKFPYNNGHVMVIPYSHVPSIENLPVEALTDLMLTVNHTLAALRQVYNPQRFNVGVNLGGEAGAWMAGNVRIFIDTAGAGFSNFLLIVGDRRGTPGFLDEAPRRL